MKQFQQSQQLSMPWTCEYGAEFASILGGQRVGTLTRDYTTDVLYVKHNVLVSAAAATSFSKLYSGATSGAMLTMCHQMYPENCISDVNCFAMTCKRVTHLNVTYSLDGTRSERSAYVYAKWWANTNSFQEPILDPLTEQRPAIIKQFIVVNVMRKDTAVKHVIAQVSWLHPHPDRYLEIAGHRHIIPSIISSCWADCW